MAAIRKRIIRQVDRLIFSVGRQMRVQQRSTDTGGTDRVTRLGADLPGLHARPRLVPARSLAVQVAAPTDELPRDALREGEIILPAARRPQADESLDHRRGTAALTHDVPIARRLNFWNAALQNAPCELVGPLLIAGFARQLMQFIKSARGSRRSVAEAEIVHVDQIGKLTARETRDNT